MLPTPSQYIEARIGAGVVKGYASSDGKSIFWCQRGYYSDGFPYDTRRCDTILDWRPLAPKD
jgi:hypothetical protein